MTNRDRGRLEYKRNIDAYLEELSAFVGRRVSESELVPRERSDAMREAGRALECKPRRSVVVPFQHKVSDEFAKFIETLDRLNSSSVFVWTPRTVHCGALELDSIKSVDFGFPFSINAEGILVLLTSDFRDRMVLEFSVDDAGARILEIELIGENWSRAAS